MPIFFRQDRIGRNFRLFQVLKFRTMRNDKVTRIGKLLRNRGIDEILQFINVLYGNMSIVGPRPLAQNDIIRLKWDNEFRSVRWWIKPGITGPAQIFSGNGSKISFFWDRKYIFENSLRKDLIIIIISFCINVFGKKKIKNCLQYFKNNSKKCRAFIILIIYILVVSIIMLSAYLNIFSCILF